MKKYPETFNTKALGLENTPCWKLDVSNYGERKSSFVFYTRSEKYAEVKKNIILKKSPDAFVEVTHGIIKFIPL